MLLYDHRNFGISGGAPRHQINPWLQACGYRDAISHAATLPDADADRIALPTSGSSNSRARAA